MDAFDVVVIGGGTGGYTAAIRATQLGLTTAIVEREKIGGTCLHKGCIPTKLLLETTETLSRVRNSSTFGIQARDISLDYSTVLARTAEVVGTLHKNLRSVIQKHKVEIIEGQGRLLSLTQVAVDSLPASGGGRTLTAKKIVLATGSRPQELPGLPTDGENILNSDHALALPKLPQSVVIIGAGSVGMEFASFYQDVGCPVTVIEMMPHLLPLEDADLGKALAKILTARGANVLTSARVLPDRTRMYDNVVALTVAHQGSEKTVRGHKVLVAVGREAVSDDLGLENTRMQLDRGFVRVDERYQTDEPTLYAVGDVIGGLQLAHVAAAEGFLAAEAIAQTGVAEPLDYNRVPRVTYSRPHVAAMGFTEGQARELGHKVKTQRFSFRYNAMALIQDEPEGFAKIVFDADSGDLLGAHIIGHNAGELISEAAFARYLQASVAELAANIHSHPTLSEVLGEAARLSAGVSMYW